MTGASCANVDEQPLTGDLPDRRSHMPWVGNTQVCLPLSSMQVSTLMYAQQRPPTFRVGGQARLPVGGGPPMIVRIVGVQENRMTGSWEYQLRDTANALVRKGAWIPQDGLRR